VSEQCSLLLVSIVHTEKNFTKLVRLLGTHFAQFSTNWLTKKLLW